MRETKFIGQNKEKWVEFEENLKFKRKDPDKLSKLFIQITDDLSYSRTFYPNRSVRVYLNGLAQSVFHSLYKNRRTNIKRLLLFWKDELPQLIYRSRMAFLISFLIFWMSFAIGVLSSKYDPEFSRLILGNEYVQMTLENIKKGDPMGVYKGDNQLHSFLGITLNNLTVEMYTFISGLLASLGTLAMMIYNGIMVGTFQYFFIERGLFWQSFLTIWIHGTLEISTIIIAGAAGLVLGSGLVFPGSYGRMQAFRLSARRGMKILLGTVPIIVTAAFLEGFVTRYTNAPAILRLAIILLSLFFILTYYVYYPWRKARAGFANKQEEDDLPAQKVNTLELYRIRSIGDIFTDLFTLYRPYFKTLVITGAIFAAFYTLTFYWGIARYHYFYFGFRGGGFSFLDVKAYFRELSYFFNPYRIPQVFPFILSFFLTVTTSTLSCFKLFVKEQSGEKSTFIKELRTVIPRHGWKLLVMNALISMSLFLPSAGFAMFLLLFPVTVLWMIPVILDDDPSGKSMSRAGNGVKGLWGLFFLLLIVSLLMMLLVGSPLSWMLFSFLELNMRITPQSFTRLYTLFFTFTSIFGLFLIVPISIFGLGLHYYSRLEIMEATGLKQRVQHVGGKRKLYGLEQEV